MKKAISLLLTAFMLSALIGCDRSAAPSSEISSAVPAISTTESTTTAADPATTATKATTTKVTTKPQKKKRKTTTTKATKATTTTTAPPITFESRLPEVNYCYTKSEVRYRDMLRLDNGGFAVVGHSCTHDNIYSMIRIFNDSAADYDEYLFPDGNGFEQIAACRDGGFVMASYCPPYITKVNSRFEKEWITEYEDIVLEGYQVDLDELPNGNIAVLFVSVYNGENRLNYRWRLTILDPSGTLLYKFDLMDGQDIDDAEIIPDDDGGLYLIATCDESYAGEQAMLNEAYDPAKKTEVAVMHFSADFRLTWAKTVGGSGNDWIEESTMDSNGNFYLAIGTNSAETDPFRNMPVNPVMPYRRMLIKLDRSGNILYKAPLSGNGMAVDQVFGIHVRDGYAYVVGMSDYFDGYQDKYPCEQISSDGDPRVMSVYTVCVDSHGKELYRNIFRCDENTTPTDSVLLDNSSLVIAGSVFEADNPFRLPLPKDCGYNIPALFVYSRK